MASTITDAALIDASGNVLIDLQDPTGVNNSEIGGVKTNLRDLQFHADQLQPSRFMSPNRPGGSTSWTHDDLVLTTWRQFLDFSSGGYDLGARARDRLAWLLRTGGAFQYQETATSLVKILDFEPSDALSLFGSEPEDMYRALTSGVFPEGIQLSIARQPWARSASLTPSTNLLANGTLLRDSDADGLPDSFTLANGTLTISTAGEYLQAVHNAAVDIYYQEATVGAGATVTAQAEIWKTGGDRTVRFQLISRPTGTIIATVDVTATVPGTVYSITGTMNGGETTCRVKITYVSGSTSTTARSRNWMLETGSSASLFRVKDETVSNNPSGSGYRKFIPVFNPGSAPSPVELTIQNLDASSSITDIYLGMRSNGGIHGRRSLVDLLNGPGYVQCEASGNGWTVTRDASASNAVDANASGGNTLLIDHATLPNTLHLRASLTRSTLTGALREELDVWARVKAAGARKYGIQLRWGAGSQVPVPNTNAEVYHDASNASSFDYVMVNLGRIHIPPEAVVTLGTIRLELWTRVYSGTDQDLSIDYLYFRPAASDYPNDQQALIQTAEGASETWLGSDLTTPVTNPGGGTAGIVILGTVLGLDTATDNCGTPAITSTGRHKTKFRVYRYQDFGTGSETVVIRIRNTTDSTTVATKTLTIDSFGSANVNISWDAVAGKSYQAQVDDPSDGSFAVTSITDSFVPSITQNEKVRTDPGTIPGRLAAEKLDSSGQLLGDLAATIVPFWVPPGLSLIVVDLNDAALADYTEPKNVYNRTCNVAVAITPRWYP